MRCAHRILFEGNRAIGVEICQNGQTVRTCLCGARCCSPAARCNRRRSCSCPASAIRRAAASARHRGGPRAEGRRREPAGPSRRSRVVYGYAAPTRSNAISLNWLRQALGRVRLGCRTPRPADDGRGADRPLRAHPARSSTRPICNTSFSLADREGPGEAMHDFPGSS